MDLLQLLCYVFLSNNGYSYDYAGNPLRGQLDALQTLAHNTT